ncbi:RNA-binding protein 8A, putative [Perkinsus marinus ATCC 50983]|uniref:RNA-binding protein 8A, putative n=1 Tax=Perkinsus marinus (strain ATCC 50983 / TXsc) TaxID=423536 RepID=C5LK23_PERM5|nr:RNA-binding protein 8A, putative [Perkinsus marinus ATCC 50983]EER02912.1 RNA-binding protein 8A, putative [Perkinsus marinus ATCC 50983]|eukprot:XP_002771096.1 RNA-binding protein 8A, putative [Perkinsus marinus ATCC 50983]
MASMSEDRYSGKSGVFDSLDSGAEGATSMDTDSESSAATQPGAPARSIEGWVIFLTGLHEETQEDDVMEVAMEFGDVRNLHLNLDRRTGFVKGYCLIEYESKSEASSAISGMSGKMILETPVTADWAFVRPPPVGSNLPGDVLSYRFNEG